MLDHVALDLGQHRTLWQAYSAEDTVHIKKERNIVYIYSLQKDTWRAGEMTQGLSIICSPRGPEFDSWYPQSSSMLSVISVPGDLTSLSSFCGYPAHMCCTERHGLQTLVQGEELN